ncbi:MAG: helix-turn-helix domain-containing protein [Pseudomonadota bacterium]
MGQLEKFETATIAPAHRLAFWNDLVGQIYGGTFVNADRPDFDATMWRWSVGQLDMIRPRSERSHVGRAPDPRITEERVVLHLQRRGTSRHHQGGREADLHPGDFALCSANHPYAIDLMTAHELLVVEFPRTLIAERVRGLDDRFACRVSGASPSGRLFHDFLLSLWHQGDQSDADPDWQNGVSSIFADLVALAVNGLDVARDVAPGATLRSKVLALVEARLGDPELRTATIAEELHISDRTVQNLFAAMGTTPSAHILERRLTRGAEMLTGKPESSITEVAFDLGFNDSAYFARCFRQQFGTTPRAWRGLC